MNTTRAYRTYLLRTLVVAGSLLLAAGCTPFGRTPIERPTIDPPERTPPSARAKELIGTWNDERGANISFSTSHQARGNDGCDEFSAEWELSDGRTVLLIDRESTARMCTVAGTLELSDTMTWARVGDELKLTTSDGVTNKLELKHTSSLG